MLSLTDDRFDVLTEIDLEADLKNNISIKTKINHWTIFWHEIYISDLLTYNMHPYTHVTCMVYIDTLEMYVCLQRVWFSIKKTL